jgi:RNA polymerase sigma-70 factor (ECF subfamily)
LEPDELCRELYPRLVGSLRLYLGDLATAEEVAQDALCRTIDRWPEVSRLEHREAWVFRVAFNLATSRLRRRQTERRALARVAQRPDTTDAGDIAGLADVIDVRAAVAALPRRQRQAVVLRYYVDLPVDDVATVMGCRPGTAKAHLHQAIEALQRSGLIDVPSEEPRAGQDAHG